jgi:hypothetical protein
MPYRPAAGWLYTDVVVIVLDWIDGRFSDVGIGCEVHDRPGPVRIEHPQKVFFVAQVARFQWTPFDRFLMTAFEVIEGDRHVAGAGQGFARMASYKSGSACHNDGVLVRSASMCGRGDPV